MAEMLSVSFAFQKDRGLISNVPGKPEITIKDPIVDDQNQYSPTEYLLFAMGGCSAADVLLILRKMKNFPERFEVRVEAEREPVDPKVVRFVNIQYMMEGSVDPEKAERAINLSLTKYCSVSIIVKRGGADLRYSLVINGKPVKEKEKPQEIS
ncbi:OsmC family protein [Thermoplasmatales archaeon AK]|nr:OsmC family protein [Thermoplasmatales archaeon AK]